MVSSDSSCSSCGCGPSGPVEPAAGATSGAVATTWSIRVAEMDCQEEVGLLRKQLAGRPGVTELRFDLLDRRLDVDVTREGPDGDRLVIWIRQIGLTPILLGTESEEQHQRQRVTAARRAVRSLWIGGIANLVGLAWPLLSGESWTEALAHGHTHEPGTSDDAMASAFADWPVIVAHLIAVVACGTRLVPRAWAAVKLRRADMNVLMVVAVVGAIAIGEWAEAGLVTWLFALALQLEQASLGRARDAIGRLMNLAPPTARLRSSTADTRSVPIEQVPIGGLIEVLPGDRVPLDGVIVGGATDVDRSPLTGESAPAACGVGDELLAGTSNLTGNVTLRVTQGAGDTHLDRVAKALREAQRRRGATERWVDRFAEVYTPAVLVLAALAALAAPLLLGRPWGESIHLALILLVTACPCALVISTPVTIVAALTAAARRGVILRGGDVLERLAAVDSVVFDKTGTLTTGATRVASIEADPGSSIEQVLRTAAALEARSAHPLSAAIAAASRERFPRQSNEVEPELSTRLVPGAGVETLDPPQLWIGNERMIVRHRAGGSESSGIGQVSSSAVTSVWVGQDDRIWGRIELSDAVRETAKAAIAGLRRLGIDDLSILSGDRSEVVAALGAELGIATTVGELLPEEKCERIEQRRRAGARVMMVGDGINDSAALASAQVSLAMGLGSSDLAKAAADGVLTHDALERVPWSIAHARRARAILIQNLTVAIVAKVIFFVLAIAGLSSLWLAILADTGVSLAVIANALRALIEPGASVDISLREMPAAKRRREADDAPIPS